MWVIKYQVGCNCGIFLHVQGDASSRLLVVKIFFLSFLVSLSLLFFNLKFFWLIYKTFIHVFTGLRSYILQFFSSCFVISLYFSSPSPVPSDFSGCPDMATSNVFAHEFSLLLWHFRTHKCSVDFRSARKDIAYTVSIGRLWQGSVRKCSFFSPLFVFCVGRVTSCPTLSTQQYR